MKPNTSCPPCSRWYIDSEACRQCEHNREHVVTTYASVTELIMEKNANQMRLANR